MRNTLALIGLKLQAQSACSDLAQRLMVQPGELYRVPPTYTRIRVASGCAHITHAGQDIILSHGQNATLDAKQDVALVSALKGRPVVIELCRRERDTPARGDILLL